MRSPFSTRADAARLQPAGGAAVQAQGAGLALKLQPERRLTFPAARNLHRERGVAVEAALHQQVVKRLTRLKMAVVAGADFGELP